ncbi:MAG: extracellular solute-binding protein, family 1 [uncultured Nocardioidaceae bacterium]|uniref:Extracellular solute-binding protein, family 1 n=1 Tax=uncultured Nocardioidaceae bacterium TaxID=253824 RepID=A0A6J4MQ71_9ACTN|nr:MAG: extracellular solute-binding protein, family 1 [uncultured Nocardioidaceae bacterium]
MRNTKVVTVASVSLLALVAGCTGTGTTTGSNDEGDPDAGIRWLVEEPEDAAAVKALKEHVATFTEESGVEVEVSTVPFESFKQIVQTQLRSGEGPDVLNWGSGPDFGGRLAEAGLLMDLTDAYEERGWEVYDFAKERVTTPDGMVYGIPGELESIGVFYNKELLEENGVPEPTTMADLEEAAAGLKEAGIIPLAVGDQEGWEGGHLLSMALGSAIGGEGMNELFTGERPWDSPEVVEAVQTWQDFHEAGYLPEEPTAVNYDTSIAMFYSGEAAMIPTGSWLVGEIDDNTDFEVGFLPFPAPEGEGVFTAGLGSGPFISAQTGNEEGALEFMDFLASPEHGTWTVENLHTIPPMELDTSGLDVSPLFADVLEKTAAVAESGDFGQNIDVMASNKVNEAMYNGFQALFTGEKTAEEVAADLEAAAGA